jgi:hypothetical protein
VQTTVFAAHVKYRCVQRVVVQREFNDRSEKVLVLLPGDSIMATESCAVPSSAPSSFWHNKKWIAGAEHGPLRLRCAEGWVTDIDVSGAAFLQPLPPEEWNRRHWASDTEGAECETCHRTFSTFVRRHHCRACGQLYCHRCSNYRMLLPKLGYGEPQRVCYRCSVACESLEVQDGNPRAAKAAIPAYERGEQPLPGDVAVEAKGGRINPNRLRQAMVLDGVTFVVRQPADVFAVEEGDARGLCLASGRGGRVRVGQLEVGAVVVGEREMISSDGHPGVAHRFEGRLVWTPFAVRPGSQQLAVQQQQPEACVVMDAASLQEAAQLHSRQGRPVEARAMWERALQVDPRHVRALCSLGQLHASQGRPEEALGLWERGFEVDPRHVPTLGNLGQLHSMQGRPAEARVLWERILAIDPDNSKALAKLKTLTPKQGSALPEQGRGLDLPEPEPELVQQLDHSVVPTAWARPPSAKSSATTKRPELSHTDKPNPAASVVDTTASFVDNVGKVCLDLEKHAHSGIFTLRNQFTNAHGDVMEVAADVAKYAPIVGCVLTAVHTVYKVVKAVQNLSAVVDDFLRQVATVSRLLRVAFVGMMQLTPEAERHMSELLGVLTKGQAKCKDIGNRGTLAWIALSKSDDKALKVATVGVTKYLGLCVAEVAAEAAPRLAAMQMRLSQMASISVEDKAKLAALPNGSEVSDETDDCKLKESKASTRGELEETMKHLMEKQKRMEEDLARKQDAAQSPQPNQEVAISVGGGSMQVQAFAVAAAQAVQSQSAADGALQAVQVQEQIAALTTEVVQLGEQMQEVRVHTGLQLSLRQATAKICDEYSLDRMMTTAAVIAHVQEDLQLTFDDGSPRDKVQQICAELGIETGWGALAAALEPEYDDVEREELIHGCGAGAQNDDIC